MTVPAVSVALPVYNAGRYLAASLSSILGQTFRDLELVAVNDGSTDDSLAILQDFAVRDPRLRIISRPNTGLAGALNDAWRAARAPLVARMDADDIAFPERFARQVSFLAAHPEVVGLGSSVVFIDSADCPVKACPRTPDHATLETALLSGDGGALIHPVVMLRRSTLEAIGGYRPEAYYIEDLDLYLRLAQVGRLANLPEALLFYRVHTGSMNFVNYAGRRESTLNVLAQAHRARGLPFDPATAQLPPAWSDVAAHDRDWAVTALQFGRRRVALRHALRACRLQPTNPAAWRGIAYSLRAPMPATPATLPATDWFRHPAA